MLLVEVCLLLFGMNYLAKALAHLLRRHPASDARLDAERARARDRAAFFKSMGELPPAWPGGPFRRLPQHQDSSDARFEGHSPLSDSTGDATSDYPSNYRERGRFGSHPSHDDLSDEGRP